jgi:hypothetical protein
MIHSRWKYFIALNFTTWFKRTFPDINSLVLHVKQGHWASGNHEVKRDNYCTDLKLSIHETSLVTCIFMKTEFVREKSNIKHGTCLSTKLLRRIELVDVNFKLPYSRHCVVRGHAPAAMPLNNHWIQRRLVRRVHLEVVAKSKLTPLPRMELQLFNLVATSRHRKE